MYLVQTIYAKSSSTVTWKPRKPTEASLVGAKHLTDHTFPVTDTFSAISNTLFALTTNPKLLARTQSESCTEDLWGQCLETGYPKILWFHWFHDQIVPMKAILGLDFMLNLPILDTPIFNFLARCHDALDPKNSGRPSEVTLWA